MNSVKIIPYIPIDGVMPFRDSFIMQMFDLILFERTVDKVFFDGTITNRRHFLAKVKRPDNLFFFVLDRNSPAAFFWLDNMTQRRAHIHFCVLRSHWGSGALHLGKTALAVIGGMKAPDGQPLFKMVAGITEASNVLAIRYAKSLGLTKCGYLPGYLFNAKLGTNVDAAILAYTFGG